MARAKPCQNSLTSYFEPDESQAQYELNQLEKVLLEMQSQVVALKSSPTNTVGVEIEKSLVERLQAVRTLSMILTISSLGTAVVAIWSTIIGGSPMVAIGWMVACLIFFISYLLAQLGKHAQTVNYTVCLQVIGVQAVVVLTHLQPKSDSAILVLLLIVPVLIGVLNFKGIFRYLFNLCSALILLGLYILDESIRLSGFNPQPASFDNSRLAYLLLAYLVITPLVAVFVRREKQVTQLATDQATQLKELLHTLAVTTDFGVKISQDLAGITAQLSTASYQQADSETELAVVITQVTGSLEELNETASQIATMAYDATQAVDQAVMVATQVKESSLLAASSGQEGQQAVAQTNQSVAQVRNRIEMLGQHLLHLTAQTGRVGSIIQLIDEIADETHLLALNASIEAAGTAGISGDRFGVIAQEVKHLSERSRESTKEIRQTIEEMHSAVSDSLLVAEEGQKDSSIALSRSQMAGVVIEKLNQVIMNSATQANKILAAAEKVKLHSEEINLATRQQRSASRQILLTMREISEVSQETVGSVAQLSNVAKQVNLQIDELNSLLAKSNQLIALH